MSAIPRETIREIIRGNNLKSVSDVYETIKEMFKDVLQEMLEAELDETLGYDKYEKSRKNTSNSRNGYSKKVVKSRYGDIELDIPRDRNGEFEPKIVPKYKRDISELDEKIIALYSRGMSTRDIHDQIKDMYGIEVSAEMVSKITDKILPDIKEWQNRPLEAIYPFVFMDAIHYKVRSGGQIINKAAYVVLGVNIEGYKDVLGVDCQIKIAKTKDIFSR